MSDASNEIHIGENSPEQVAFRLFKMIVKIEKKHLHPVDVDKLEDGETVADRSYILSTFAECRQSVLGNSPPTDSKKASKAKAMQTSSRSTQK